jgi:hypothetical protein
MDFLLLWQNNTRIGMPKIRSKRVKFPLQTFAHISNQIIRNEIHDYAAFCKSHAMIKTFNDKTLKCIKKFI